HTFGNSCTMSVHVSTSLAPSRSSLWTPALVGDVILPGTAYTSRPRSAAKPAVDRLPLRSAASTTTTPRTSAANLRVAAGQGYGSGAGPGGNCVTSAPRVATSSASRRFSGG